MNGRTKVVALATSLLVGVSMMGVGFASWVIANQATSTATGNVKADAVSDESMTLEVTGGATDQNIVFGAPAVQQTLGAWLVNEGGATEVLTANFTLTVSDNIGNISVSLTSAGYGNDEEDGFWKAVAAGYLAAPVVSVSSDVEGAFSVQTGSADTLSEGGAVIIERVGATVITGGTTVTVTLAFDWGTQFNGENPYDYYSELDYATYHDEAHSNLDNLYNYLNGDDGLTYTVTFAAER